MNHNLKVTNLETSEAIERYLGEKLGHILKFIKGGDSNVRADVELRRASNHHRHGGEVFAAEINLHANGRQLYATAEANDLYAAIDAVKDDIVRQLTTGYKKRLSLLRRGGRAVKNMLRRWSPFSPRE
jgi:ribosomal subunit interface protein